MECMVFNTNESFMQAKFELQSVMSMMWRLPILMEDLMLQLIVCLIERRPFFIKILEKLLVLLGINRI